MRAAPPLTISSLVKQFSATRAVNNLSLTLEKGQVLGLIGPNGAGKTTTVKLCLGLLQPDSGSISLFGSSPENPDVRRRIGYMPEHPSFYTHLTGRELLAFAGALTGVSRGLARHRATELLEAVDLTEATDRHLGGYSKGMLQRIGLAQALINEPELLILDEPLDGLDPLGRVRIRSLLTNIKAKGTAILVSSHILSDIELIADSIAVLHHGNLLAHDTPSKVMHKQETLEEAFLRLIAEADDSSKEAA
jgi:ABC-2 type transport system ATP-binding protein